MGLNFFGGGGGLAGAHRFPAHDRRAYQCWIDEGRPGRVG